MKLTPDEFRLALARSCIAEPATQSDAALVMACAVVEELSDDADERSDATALRQRLEPVSL